MKIVVTIDSFKGTLSSYDACSIVADRLQSLLPEADVEIVPIADGGEGTIEALIAARDGYMCSAGEVTGPLPDMRCEGVYGWLPDDRTAIIEMSRVSGLAALPENKRNPLHTTTRGTGELIKAAVEGGAERILLTLGGSATVDGGTGAARALGWSFIGRDGMEVLEGGEGLTAIREIIPPSKSVSVPDVKVLCDVTNPLCGLRGAATVYGPQKGATPAMVKELEAGLWNLSECIVSDLGVGICDIPGSGAAGGFGGGAVAFFGGELVPGFEVVAETVGLREKIQGCDIVITGEGQLDEQSLQGKVISGVADYARASGASTVAVTGRVAVPFNIWKEAGIAEVFETSAQRVGTPSTEEARKSLSETVERVAYFIRNEDKE